MADTVTPTHRRRGAGYVTQNACNECKKKKAKCDGNNPCARCEHNGVTTCHYDTSVKVRKEDLRTTIRELQNYRQMSEDIFACLASEEHRGLILQELKNGNTLGSIWGMVSKSNTHMQSQLPLEKNEDEMEWAGDVVENTREEPKQDTDEEQDAEPWSKVISSEVHIEHLFSLYFCWEYPIFATLSRQHFLSDYQERRHRYCSSLLVNAILAIGSSFSDMSGINAGIGTTSEISGQDLFSEAERLLAKENDIPQLTTVQALGLMSIFEISRGNQNQSIFYSGESVRMAVEMGLHLHPSNPQLPQIELEVRSATIWGAFALDNAWCIIKGCLPHISRRGVLIPKGAFPEAEEQTTSLPYVGDDLPLEPSELQTSHVRSVHIVTCELFEVVHEALYILYLPGLPLIGKHILQIYHRYLAWYDSVPVTFRLGVNYTPAVIFMHIYYQFAVLTLFGPFIRLRLRGTPFRPREICFQATETIKALLASYRRLYSLRRTPSFLSIITLASNLFHALEEKSPGDSVPNHGVDELQEMGYSHEAAVHGAQVLASLQAQMPISPAKKATLTGNIEDVCKHICVAIEVFGLDRERCCFAGQSFVLNSLFSPFPFQVLPALEFKNELHLAGFGLIVEEDSTE
ncbi:related to nitrate assimilation regulatory protein nirA [Rhynchosporium graminicola]|uniref:Related to nitrate assimilation regulatory protein nirA n=1 Tax=Rhynchosporium graminicola TaxID=2792576 RepID=A0A1E1LTG7_9HELO|nr:related to nitrate assimilation regulatory protein nirA [Rhynchosporium commune]